MRGNMEFSFRMNYFSSMAMDSSLRLHHSEERTPMKKFFMTFLFLALVLPHPCLADPPGFMKHRMGTLEGQVFYADKPVADALLAFFDHIKGLPPISGQSGRIPESLGRTDAEGKFKVKLIQGSYYLGILLRPADSPPGPPREGEKFYFGDDGQGKLRKLSITDFAVIDAGRIDCSLPEVFQESEDHFTVEGTVYEEEGEKPFPGAIVLGKTTPTMRRPEYFSVRTGEDGKFSIKLPPDRTFYLVAREAITGTRPEAGESIGKYGAESFSEASSDTAQKIGGPPPGVEKKEIPKVVADSIPVSGANGEVISGLKIVMYTRPDETKLRAENMRLAEAPDYETGFAISNLFFASNSYELDERSFSELNLWVGFFKGRPDIAIDLIGHTDSVGTEEYNRQLSRRRAEAVAHYLIDKGISSARITVNGFGSSKPIADNATEEGKSKNRRVDIKFEK